MFTAGDDVYSCGAGKVFAQARLAWGLIIKECLNIYFLYPEGLLFYISTLHSKINQ